MTKRRFLGLLAICFVIGSLQSLTIREINAASDPTILVNPRVSGAAPTESFSIKIVIANVTELYAWEFYLTFSPSVLQVLSIVEGPFLKQAGGTVMATPTINNTGGYVDAGAALLSWDEGGAGGDGVLATVNLRVMSAGESPLHFSLDYTQLRTYDGELPVPMTYQAVDGIFGYPRDLAVTGVVASSSSVPAGESVSLTAAVLNKGVVDEIFNATVYRNSTVINTRTELTLASGASTSVVFDWDTTGVPAGIYVMKAEVSLVSGENDTTNNVFSDGIVTIELVHDIALTGVTVTPSSVQSGGEVRINVIVLNKGSTTESFDVTVSYDDTVVETKNVAGLAPGASEKLIFTWDTSGVASGNYALTAKTSTILGETATEDNVFSNVALQITSPPFALSIEWTIVIIAVVVVLVVGVFLYMKRKSKKA